MSGTAPTAIPPPPTAIVDSQGRMTQAFLFFLQALLQRTGGLAGISLTALQSEVTAAATAAANAQTVANAAQATAAAAAAAATDAETLAELMADAAPASGILPAMDGAAAPGVAVGFARGDHVHPTDTSRAPLASPTFTGAVVLPGVNGGPLAGSRNVLINGAMDIWQRGTSATSPGSGYNADRWQFGYDGSGSTLTVSQQAASEQALLDLGLSNWWNLSQTVAGSGGTFKQLVQKIEKVRTLAGRTCTLSFWGKATGALGLNALLSQNFGTGGSPSTAVNQSAQAFTLTTTPTKFTMNFTLPTILGKTLGTNGNDSLQVVFNMPLNSTMNLSISGVQLEIGPAATPFEYRPPGAELALCQRYFAVVDASARFPASAAGQTGDTMIAFPATLRATPTMATVTIPTNNLVNVTGWASTTVRSTRFEVNSSAAGDCYSVSGVYSANAEL